ncbi:hypothetical protein [Staphylococcus lutrae]|uniref:Uncharacterized protein n=1 Tax=Staphylococcus lutrae TaxID=155085 RepID=A0AAC9WIT8_9STAP|nr:hypothetical protein [Staphylococcus lutrae]ARJ50624.1 hypothetical protein B5P37_04470 [Staphylococcus lutrae]PNZ38811.1 hypothetical protein CD134_03255 [Staphylococcus lutrae]
MKKSGFNQLRTEVRDKVKQMKDPKRIIETIITVDGKVDIEIALQSLNFEQQAIYQHLDYAKCVFGDASPIEEKAMLCFGMTEYGRLLLGEKYFFDAYTQIWGYFIIPHETMTVIEQDIARLHAQEKWLYQTEVVPFFRQLSQQDVVKVLDAIKNKIDFMAPILLYYYDQTFTTFYHYNNLLRSLEGETTRFLLDDLATQDVSTWTTHERTFIFNMYAILQSGPPARGEEVNGVHFSLTYLSRYFKQKREDYQQVVNSPQTIGAVSLLTQAQMLAQLRDEVTEHAMIYRQINGLNLHKKERLIEKEALTAYTDQRLEAVLLQMLEVHTIEVYYAAFYHFIDQHRRSDRLQQLLETIVSYAIEATHSDIGMTRSFRQPYAYYCALKNNDIATICDWNQKMYFCCVIPSGTLIESFQGQPQMLTGILVAISKRMEYNSWHYTPGNFLNRVKNMERHYYFPPVMSDITTWSNQHHKGHVFADVKYAMRCPGTIQCPPYDLAAFYDLRLMRSTGNTYTEDDLMKALYYQRILGELYQAWFDFGMQTACTIDITAYDRAWYQQQYQQI